MRAAAKDKRKRLRQFRELARQRQNGLCFYCRQPMAKAGSAAALAAPMSVETIEHRRPKCRGGTDSAANLVLTCRACNTRKASMNETAFLAQLSERDHI
ncbi:HNH endonuclease [Oleomonas cavernae]|uniref:HNH endonuclease n=1 Tax=Oleomonas cavernae TaxID=2320859 RepID=A0A418WGQ1_9PROT|nr:HNH endonuclease signature motif containing protein [Oleomonas cavernae]RJF89148.1 HNH endonuclease [Oleomonas cavernae]